MNIDHLEPEELGVECAIRSLSTNPQSLVLLRSQLLAETNNPAMLPSQPHDLAIKNPLHEIKLCSLKVNRIWSLLDSPVTLSSQEFNKIRSRLVHLERRCHRLQNITGPDRQVMALAEKCQHLSRMWRSQELDGIFSSPLAEDCVSSTPVVPRTNKEPTQQFLCLTNPYEDNIDGVDNNSPIGIVPESGTNQTCNAPENTDDRLETNQSLLNILSGIERLLGDIHHKVSQPNIQPQHPSGVKYPSTLFEETWYNKLPRNNERDIGRILRSWNLRFSGSNNDTPIERFIARVDQMAQRAGIDLNQSVETVTCLLSGIALEWFWVTIERCPSYSWDEIKTHMVERFCLCLPDREIKKALDARKQKCPRERYSEFQDDILRLALQAKTPIPESDLIEILTNNMRPGLQVALAGKKFRNISSLAQECRTHEDLWVQLRYNPEGNITAIAKPQIHELSKITQTNASSNNTKIMMASETDEDCEANEVCAMSASRHFPKSRFGSKNEIKCWNCGATDHLYQYCRQIKKRVFCYGCGKEEVLLPDCEVCQGNRQGNWRAKVVTSRETHFLNQSTPRIDRQTEEAASNTVPTPNRFL